MRNLLLILKQRKFYIYRELGRHEGNLISWAIYGARQTINLMTLMLPVIAALLHFNHESLFGLLAFLPQIICSLIVFFFYDDDFEPFFGIIIMINFFYFLCFMGYASVEDNVSTINFSFIFIATFLPLIIGGIYSGIANLLNLNFKLRIVDKLHEKVNKRKHAKEKTCKKKSKEINIDKKYISKNGISLQSELKELNESMKDKDIKLKRSDELYVMIPSIEELLEVIINSKNLDSKREAEEVLDAILLKLQERNYKFSRDRDKEIIAINKKLIDKIK